MAESWNGGWTGWRIYYGPTPKYWRPPLSIMVIVCPATMKPLKASLASGQTKLTETARRRQRQLYFCQSLLPFRKPSRWTSEMPYLKLHPYHLYTAICISKGESSLITLKTRHRIKSHQKEVDNRQTSTARLDRHFNHLVSTSLITQSTIPQIIHFHPTIYFMHWWTCISNTLIPGAPFFIVDLPWILFSDHLRWMKQIKFFYMQL